MVEAYSTLSHNYEQLQNRACADKVQAEQQYLKTNRELANAKESMKKYAQSSEKYKKQVQLAFTEQKELRNELQRVTKRCQQEHNFEYLASLWSKEESIKKKNNNPIKSQTKSRKRNRQLRVWKKEIQQLVQLLSQNERQLQDQKILNKTLAEKTYFYKTKSDSLDIMVKRYNVSIVEGMATQLAQIIVKKIATTGEILLIVKNKNLDGTEISEEVQDMRNVSLRLFNVEIEDELSATSDFDEPENDASATFLVDSVEINRHRTMKTMKYQFELTFLNKEQKTIVFQCGTLRERNKCCLAIQEMIKLTKAFEPYPKPGVQALRNDADYNEKDSIPGWMGSSSVSSAYSFTEMPPSHKSSINSLSSWASSVPSSLPNRYESNGKQRSLSYENCL